MSNYFDTLRDVSKGISIKKDKIDRSKVTVINNNNSSLMNRRGIKNNVLSEQQQKEMILARHQLMNDYRLRDDELRNGMLVVLYKENGYRNLDKDDE